MRCKRRGEETEAGEEGRCNVVGDEDQMIESALNRIVFSSCVIAASYCLLAGNVVGRIGRRNLDPWLRSDF